MHNYLIYLGIGILMNKSLYTDKVPVLSICGTQSEAMRVVDFLESYGCENFLRRLSLDDTYVRPIINLLNKDNDEDESDYNNSHFNYTRMPDISWCSLNYESAIQVLREWLD